MAHRVKIIQAPQGPNPLWVREAWIGLYLPVLSESKLPQRFFTFPDKAGYIAEAWKSYLFYFWFLLTGQMQITEGYAISSVRALEILEIVRPDAVAWWKENAPVMLRPGMVFLFDSHSCKWEEEVI